MKFTNKEIESLIKEELDRTGKEIVAEILGSTSRIEVEELLRVRFKEMGGVPPNIGQLSILFPVLESAGLSDIVDAYVEKAKATSPQEAWSILDPVKDVIIKIKSGR